LTACSTKEIDVKFATDFVWGAATAAYQIEGAASADGRGLSVWDMLCRKPGAIWNGQDGAVACDHYNRMREDVALMKQLGLRGYRFSVSWSRVLPEGVGRVNEKGMDFYDRLVDELLAAGIQPWLTLFHWDYPHELFCRGGWLNRDSIDWFAEYTQVVARHLSDRVTNWMTFNEPQMFLALGHVAGSHAPGVKYADAEMLRVCHHAFCAHGKAVQALRAETRQPAQIGYAPAAFVKMPPQHNPEGIELARKAMFAVTNRGHFNNAFYMDPMLLGRYPEDHLKLFHDVLPPVQPGDMELMHQPLDFLGANIYGGVTVEPRTNDTGDYPERQEVQGHPITMMGWHTVPESLYWGPRFLAERYKLPIVITENGMSGHDWVTEDGAVHDPYRIHFTRQYLKALSQAVSDGVDVRGYFYWSLMDNFEWAEGYKQRFGLIHVDYATQKRTPKDSFDWYCKLIATNGEELT
jgi:beta-glucosidase